jgi:hypothetical protein
LRSTQAASPAAVSDDPTIRPGKSTHGSRAVTPASSH